MAAPNNINGGWGKPYGGSAYLTPSGIPAWLFRGKYNR